MSLIEAELALEWSNFKEKHSRNFESPEEEAKRFEIFKENLKEIHEHNFRFKNGEESYSKAVNAFADRTPDELPVGGLLGKR